MSVLDTIFETKREEVAAARASISDEEIRRLAESAPSPRGFKRALEAAHPSMALIAEIKKASPSKGVIRPDFDPIDIAKAYERAGAHALSVLTDRQYFQGGSENLIAARGVTRLPCLRKDFLYEPYQIYEARAMGADAVLLIAASLSPIQIRSLRALALSLGMDALVEVHNDSEAAAAVSLGCDLIGVNNRDLGNFETSLGVSERLIPELAKHAFVVSESAIETNADVDRMQGAGARAVLVGTTFCASPDIEAKVREVMGT